MAQFCYKVRDTATGKYWNGSTYRSVFNDQGFTWKTRKQCESKIAYFVSYRIKWSTATNPVSIPSTWEIVEIELKPVEKTTYDTSNFLKGLQLKGEVTKFHPSLGYFVEKMNSRNMLDKIEFLFKLKPAEGKTYVDMDRIKEARAQLRQLGVKTRTFKESNGVFGMMDRSQALKARLVLDIEHSVDLSALRKQVGL